MIWYAEPIAFVAIVLSDLDHRTCMVQRLPIGIQNFRKLREGDLYYVDKSELMDQILTSGGEVHLFTRPRRFGKSLNLSMLDCYFNMEYKGIADQWFEGLRIRELRPDDPEMNSYPVIRVDFKDLRTDYEGFVEDIGIKISELFFQHKAQLTDEDYAHQRDTFMAIMERRSSVGELRYSLRFLCEMLYRRFDKPVVILIDEYDSPINGSSGTPDQRSILDFMKGMLSTVLKNGSMSMRFGVVTGVMQVSKESIFSGLNNLKVNNIFSDDCNEMFGFTPDEVQRICSDYGHPERFEEAREWYDGYRFGDADIYNPWSVLNYVDRRFEPDTYWAGTSGNSIIPDLLDRADRDVWDDLNRLGSGESILKALNPTVTYSELSEGVGPIYSIMVMSGYLRASKVGSRYEVSIPNAEMYRVFGSIVSSRAGNGMPAILRDMADSMLTGDAEALGGYLRELLMEVMGSRALDREHTYQAFFAGASLSLLGRYRISVDKESGDGFHDILFENIRGNGVNVLIEFKKSRSKKDETLIKEAEKALEQIHRLSYYDDLKGDTILYGVSFRGKQPFIVSERITL